MHNIYDCVDAFSRLLDKQYKIVVGRKGVARTLYINFAKSDCFHLMGLQYLKDREELNKDRAEIFDEIRGRKIDAGHIEKSSFYGKIRDRVDMLPMLEMLFDSNDTIFKYNSHQNSFSMIQADYLMKNTIEMKNIFIFLSRQSDNEYFCRSFFAQDKVDYSVNQPKWTLLYKEKIDKGSGDKEILYNRLKIRNKLL